MGLPERADWNNRLANLARTWALDATKHDRAAREARANAARARKDSMDPNSVSTRAKVDKFERQAEEWEGKAVAYRRRAVAANAGYFLLGPPESGDKDFMQAYQTEIASASRDGRVRYYGDVADIEDEFPLAGDDGDEAARLGAEA